MRTDILRAIDRIRRDGDHISDGHLLARFVATRDEASFAALVGRHGRMVLGVCHRVLRNIHDAEDAFQATFLVLARKAKSLVVRESLGPYLYRVAYHTALEVAAAVARRRLTETQAEAPPHPLIFPAEPEDWRPLLDLELSRLPERLRAAVVLCHLEGRTRREAARDLGIKEGTLSSRLTAAHKLLAKRLGRCGLVLSVCAVSAALSEVRVSAAVPAALAKSVAKAALTVGSTPASFLMMKGALKMMFATKWWPVVAAVVVTGTMAVVGVGLRPGDNSGSAQAAPPKESELDALRKEVELLKNTLQIVVDKNRDLERELASLRVPKGGAPVRGDLRDTPPVEEGSGSGLPGAANRNNFLNRYAESFRNAQTPPASGASEELIRDLEEAVKGLRGVRGGTGSRATPVTEPAAGRGAGVNEKLIQDLEAVLKGLREAKGAADPRRN